MALRVNDTEMLLDLRPEIGAAPAHHAMHLDIRAGLDQARQLGQLSLRQLWRATRAGTVTKTLDPLAL